MPAVAGRGRGRRTINEINMVPFIDVMLVLLIIFMVTAPLIAPSMIDLPSVGKAKEPPKQMVQVIVQRDESLAIKGKDDAIAMPLDRIVAEITRIQVGQPPGATAVVISADRNVKYEAVVKVMDALNKAGVQRVGLSVQLAK
ncbi:biopolymer transporter ExbD [Ramlibacter sp.]|uniref:biopolymer transporter ExbD n=1 Tax=Ramlibacter sp. TaxID=1917967 RepID=UPI003D147FB5